MRREDKRAHRQVIQKPHEFRSKRRGCTGPQVTATVFVGCQTQAQQGKERRDADEGHDSPNSGTGGKHGVRGECGRVRFAIWQRSRSKMFEQHRKNVVVIEVASHQSIAIEVRLHGRQEEAGPMACVAVIRSFPVNGLVPVCIQNSRPSFCT